jgi:hypothetical protein
MTLYAKIGMVCVYAVTLVGCSSPPPQQPADPAVVARIERVCQDSGLFKVINGVVVLAVPAASIPVALLNAGVDQVCMNPERFASDISTVQWLVKNLHKRRQQVA